MATRRGTLSVLIVLLVAERVRAQYASRAADSATVDQIGAHELQEESAVQFASICPCIVADQCSRHYGKGAPLYSQDVAPPCIEYGTVRCCSAPLTPESEPTEEQESGRDFGYHPLNAGHAPDEERLAQEDQFDGNYEGIEDSEIDRDFLAYNENEKPEESGGSVENSGRVLALETSLETPSESTMAEEGYLTQHDEYQMDETLEKPGAYVLPRAIHLESINPRKERVPEEIPESPGYSLVEPFASAQEPGDPAPEASRQVQYEERPEIVEPGEQPSARQAKVLNYAGPARVSMVIYPPSTYSLANIPNQRRDSSQQAPADKYQLNEAVRSSPRPPQVSAQQRRVPSRDNFVLKVYGKPPASQPAQKLFLKEQVDISYSPQLQAPHQGPITASEYSAHSADVQQSRQPVQNQVQRQPAAALPQFTQQSSDPAPEVQEHPQLQQQQDAEYGAMDQHAGIAHELPAQQPVYAQVSPDSIPKEYPHHQPIPAHNGQQIYYQPAAWGSQNGQFFGRVTTHQDSVNDQVARPQVGMLLHSPPLQQHEEIDVETVYEGPAPLPLVQNDQYYQVNVPSATSDQQLAPGLRYTNPETQQLPPHADELGSPTPYDQGRPTQATGYEAQAASGRIPNAAPIIPHQIPVGADIQTEDSSSALRVQPADDYRLADVKSPEAQLPELPINVEMMYEAQGLGMRSNQKLELPILDPIVPGPIELPGEARRMPSPPKFENGFKPILGPSVPSAKVKQLAAHETLFRQSVDRSPSYKQSIPVKMIQRPRPSNQYQNDQQHLAVDQTSRGSNQRYPRAHQVRSFGERSGKRQTTQLHEKDRHR